MKKFFNAMSDRTTRDPDRIGGKGLTRLQEAVDDNDLDRVRLLLKRKADINEAGLCGETPLHRAVRQNHPVIARILIEAGADVGLTDAKGRTPLHLAVLHGNATLIMRLLEAGADIRATDERGRTVMHMVPKRCEELFGILKHAGADPNTPDHEGNPPLVYHLDNERHAIALLKAGAKPDSSSQHTPPFTQLLRAAPIDWHPQLILHMLHNGANPDTRNAAGLALVHLTVQTHQPRLLHEAALRKADLTARAPNGYTLAHFLAEHPQPDVLRFVLAHHPQLATAPAHNGMTPLDIVLQSLSKTPINADEKHVDTLVQSAKQLIEKGADATTATLEGVTLMHEAVGRHLYDFIHFLATHKADINRRAANGVAPLHIAIHLRHLELLDLLLDLGAEPDLTDARGWTVLDRLAEKKDRDSPIVQRLIVAGGQYNKQLPLYPDMIRPRTGAPAKQDIKPLAPDVSHPPRLIKKPPPKNQG